MKPRLYQAFLAGFVIVLVFIGTVMILEIVLHRLFPELLGGIGILLFAPLELLVVIGAGLGLSVGAGLWLLREWPVKNQLVVMLAGCTATLAWVAALWFAFPSVPRYWLIGGAALIGGSIFALVTMLLSTRAVFRVTLFLLLIAGGAWVAFIQYHSGAERAQVEGLKNAGYEIYIPADASTRKVEWIIPINQKYDYKDGVRVHLDSGGRVIEQNIMTEQKVDHRPTADCGWPFILAESAYNTEADSLTEFSCQVVASNNGVDVYRLERRSYASYYNDYEVRQVYFALAGNTWVYPDDYLIAQSAPEELKAFEETKLMLLDLVPVHDFSPYIIRR